MDTKQQYAAASLLTADNLRSIAHSMSLRDLSRLSLPEVDQVVDVVSRVIPAGNVPGMILSGLARLTGRRLPDNVAKRDINLLLRGVEQTLDQAVYRAFFAGPAAVIWGYQHLLKLAGKDPSDSFPEGVWQFYVTYAMREDTARHANETIGFDAALRAHSMALTPIDRITAWVMAAVHTLHHYSALLENEWRERMALKIVRDLTPEEPDAGRYARLYAAWEKQRPYARGADVEPAETYPAYRRRKFDAFVYEALASLRPELRRAWEEQLAERTKEQLPRYQRQMSLLALLRPEAYAEVIEPLPLQRAHIAVVVGGRYYLIPACNSQGGPVESATVRSQIATILYSPATAPEPQLTDLVAVKRAALPSIVEGLRPELVQELKTLQCAPIIINADTRPADSPLAEIRLTERGLGDHALTLIDTGNSMVFDQSHIFFDGAWGSALAEIMTAEALSWAVYFHQQPAPGLAALRPYSPALQLSDAERQALRAAPQIASESSAETTAVDLTGILELRKRLKQRNDTINLTVNDLLVLYRALHAAAYEPDPALMAQIRALNNDPATQPIALQIIQSFEELRQYNPAVLIPIDASQGNPADRLHPMSFEMPIGELEIVQHHANALRLLKVTEVAGADLSGPWEDFEQARRLYLANLAGLGAVSTRAKEVAMQGQSASSSAIKLLAHLPPALQRLLDTIPSKFDVLNDIIKGREVFSNVGVVASTSSLRRFITAKDDNDKKTLAWGVITDANGVLHVSLRDFRPHVAALAGFGRRDLALWITRDYVEAYARGLNRYSAELRHIVSARRNQGQQTATRGGNA